MISNSYPLWITFFVRCLYWLLLLRLTVCFKFFFFDSQIHHHVIILLMLSLNVYKKFRFSFCNKINLGFWKLSFQWHKTSVIYLDFKVKNVPIKKCSLTYLPALKPTFIIPVYKTIQVIVQNIGFIMKPRAFFSTDNQPTFLHIRLLEFVVITKGDGSHRTFPLSELVCLNNKGFFCV